MFYSYNDCLKKYGNDYQISKAVFAEGIYKIAPGIYSDKASVSELAVIAWKYPNAVFTMESAFYYHSLTNVIPEKYCLATEKDDTKIIDKRVKQHFHRKDKFRIGITSLMWQDVAINVYDKERMLIELVRNKNSLPFDYYKELIKNYRKITDDMDTEKLQKYITHFSKQNSISNAIQLEVY